MENLEIEESFSTRLRKAMNVKNIKQIELAEKTKIPKASINQYLSGYAEPKQDRIFILSQALNVDPVWLMGLDVPMEKKSQEDRLLEYAKRISALDQEKQESLLNFLDYLENKK